MGRTIKKLVAGNDQVSQIIKNKLQEEYILVGDEGTCLSQFYEKYEEDLQNFKIHDTDVIVCTYPKTGTTWTQEMVWLIGHDLDYEGAKVNLVERFPFLELSAVLDFEQMDKALGKSPEYIGNSIEFAKNLKHPRFIKTHLPYSLLPDDIQNGCKNPKIIYVVRNPKDVCVSYYHHWGLFRPNMISLEDFSKIFLTNKMTYGCFWKHVMGFWQRRKSPNILIISYEEMKQNLPSVVKEVAAFLDKNLSDEQIGNLCKHLSFESMKVNKAVNGEDFLNVRKAKNLTPKDGRFMRSGIVGKYKEELSPETIEKLNLWIKENIQGTSFEQTFNYID